MHIRISRAIPRFFKTELAPLTGCCHGDLQAVLLLIDIFVVQRLVRRYLTLEHELLILPRTQILYCPEVSKTFPGHLCGLGSPGRRVPGICRTGET
jgi:hypothetical protein